MHVRLFEGKSSVFGEGKMFHDGFIFFVGWILGTLCSACTISRLISGTPAGWRVGFYYAACLGLAITLAVACASTAGAQVFSHNYAGIWMLLSMLFATASGLVAGKHARRWANVRVPRQFGFTTMLVVSVACCLLVFLNAGPHKRTTITVTNQDGTRHLNHNNKMRFGWPWEMHGSFPVFLANVATGTSIVLFLGLVSSNRTNRSDEVNQSTSDDMPLASVTTTSRSSAPS